MPYKDPEKQREYQRRYRANNKEKQAKYHKEWSEENSEKVAHYKHEWGQTPAGKKSGRIADWKYCGIVSEDYDALYERVISTEKCEFCGVILTEDRKTTSTTRCLDHDHATGEVRGVLCNCCNLKDVLKKKSD